MRIDRLEVLCGLQSRLKKTMSDAGSDYGGAGEAYEYEAEEEVNMNEDEMQALQEERELHQAGANGNHIEVLPLLVRLLTAVRMPTH